MSLNKELNEELTLSFSSPSDEAKRYPGYKMEWLFRVVQEMFTVYLFVKSSLSFLVIMKED
jgi:hypothetical protein